MRIAEVVSAFPPHAGGMGYVCYYNAMHLAGKGHDVTVFTLDTGEQENRAVPFRVVRFRPVLRHGDAGLVPGLYYGLRGFDAVHLHYPFFGAAEYVYWASAIRGQKYFLTYHMDVFGNTLMKRAVIALYEPLFLRRIVGGAAAIGGPCPDYLATTKAARFIDAGKLVQFPHAGVDTDLFQPRARDESLVEKYGLRGKTVVLFVGNMLPLKGVHLLLEAVAGLQIRGVVLLIVGGGYEEQTCRAQVRTMGIGDRVIFAGTRSHDGDLAAHYNLADMLVLPSTRSESFGMVILEAMASGKPVIASGLPGPRNVVAHGEDGYLFTPGSVDELRERIRGLVDEPDAGVRMGESGRREVVAGFSWKTIGDGVESVLAKMVG